MKKTKKLLKWVGIVLGVLVLLVVLVVVGLYLSTNIRLSKTYTIKVEDIAIPTESTAVERGRHWVSIYCTGCHGENLAGAVVLEDPSLGRLEATNLTSGRGGIGSKYTDADWTRAIRHGVNPQGRPLFVMPSEDYYYLSDKDLADIIAYLKTLPPVDNEMGGYNLTPMARGLVAAGAFGQVLAAEAIDHTGPRPSEPELGVTAAYGEYLVNVFGCRSCHGKELSGGKNPEPGAPPGPNITPGGSLNRWAESDFLTAARTGVSRYMPWKSLGLMTDDELKAIWLYLKSLPAREAKTQ